MKKQTLVLTLLFISPLAAVVGNVGARPSQTFEGTADTFQAGGAINYHNEKIRPANSVDLSHLLTSGDPLHKKKDILAALSEDDKNKAGGYKVATSSDTPKPPPKPTPIKDFLKENRGTFFLGGLGAYLGFALLGPIGILMGAVFLITISKLSDL
jgi:hypothetical protein